MEICCNAPVCNTWIQQHIVCNENTQLTVSRKENRCKKLTAEIQTN